MIIDDKIRDEKLQYDINREAVRMSAESLGTIDKYDYLTSEGILPSDQRRVIEQAKWLDTCAQKPKVSGSNPAATYVQRWALCSNCPADV